MASNHQNRTACLTIVQQVIREVKEGNADGVGRLLTTDQEGRPRMLNLEKYFEALQFAIGYHERGICHLILTHAVKVHGHDEISKQIHVESGVLKSAIMMRLGGQMLEFLEKLGMDFDYCKLSRDPRVTQCIMQHALDYKDINAVRFLINHGFDVLTSFGSETLLRLLFKRYRDNPRSWQETIVDVLKLASDPRLHVATHMQRVSRQEESLLVSVEEGHAEIVGMLVAVGCSPHHLIRNEHFRVEPRNGYLATKYHREVWKVLVACWTAEDVIGSMLLSSAIESRFGGPMLELFEELDMDFTCLLSFRGHKVTKLMRQALKSFDCVAVKFLINHGFDVNTQIDSMPQVNFMLRNVHEHHKVIMDSIILDAFRRGVNPLLKDLQNENAIEACVGVSRALPRNRYVTHGCVKILTLLIFMGFRIPGGLESFPNDGFESEWADVIAANSSPPSLQCLCRREIRLKVGSRIEMCVDQLKYPQQLKDFLLLKDIDFDALHQKYKFEYFDVNFFC